MNLYEVTVSRPIYIMALSKRDAETEARLRAEDTAYWVADTVLITELSEVPPSVWGEMPYGADLTIVEILEGKR